MSEDPTVLPYGDALSQPFWEAATHSRLVLQRCRDCAHYQFYARPFCLACQSEEVEWVEAAGTGIIYSLTTVRMGVLDELPPPYQVALVELDEGPRFLSTIVDNDGAIGDRVQVRWQEREGLPPLLTFDVVREQPR